MKPRTDVSVLLDRVMGAGDGDVSDEQMAEVRARVASTDPRTKGFFAPLPNNGITDEGYYLDLMELFLHMCPPDEDEAAVFRGRCFAREPAVWPSLILDSETSPLAFATLQEILMHLDARVALEHGGPELEALCQWAFDVAAGRRTKPKRRGRPAEASAMGQSVVAMIVNLLHDGFDRPYTTAVDTDDPARQSACQVVAMRLGTTTDHVRTTWARVCKQVEIEQAAQPGRKPANPGQVH